MADQNLAVAALNGLAAFHEGLLGALDASRTDKKAFFCFDEEPSSSRKQRGVERYNYVYIQSHFYLSRLQKKTQRGFWGGTKH